MKNVMFYTILRGKNGPQIYLDKDLFRRDINITNPMYKIFKNKIESLCYLKRHGVDILEIEPIGLLSHLKKN